MNKETLTGQATDEQIKEWKKKYGNVFFAKAEGHIAYFRKPSRQAVSYSMSMQSDPLKATESLLKSCFIDGSNVFTTDTGFMIGAADLAEKLMAIKKTELGEL